MSSPEKLSVVLPVRNGAASIANRVGRAWEAVSRLTDRPVEIIVVDDGSRDRTAGVLEDISDRYPRLRVVRHDRPRGMEAAGQTGLERATGELVFVQESDADLRPADLKRLLEMSEDPSVVAARAESTQRQVSTALLRRLRAWGTGADRQFQTDGEGSGVPKTSLQMIRRAHLQRLAAPGGDRYQLEAETLRSTSLEPV